MSLEKKFEAYTKRNRILKLDFLAEEWGCTMLDITNLICDNYQDFDNVVFDDMAVYLDYPDNDQWYYEYANGFENKEGQHCIKRHIKSKTENAPSKIAKSQGKVDKHISVFQHDRKWFKDYNDRNSKVRASFIYLELDRGGDLAKAIEDTETFLQTFPYHKGIGIWHSGNTSIHIGVPTQYFGSPVATNTKACGRGKLFYNLARMIGGNIRFDNDYFDPHLSGVEECEEMYRELFDKDPPDDPQFVRQAIEHFDPNLFYMNSMIRMPGSLHEKTKKPKALVNDLFPSFNPDDAPEIKPYLLNFTYMAWEPIKKPGRHIKSIDVRGYESFVINFFIEHIAEFDPDNMNSAGWVHSLPSPFYDDSNPDVSVCIDPDSQKFGSYRDFGNEDDNTDFIGVVSRVIKKSRRAALDYIKANS